MLGLKANQQMVIRALIRINASPGGIANVVLFSPDVHGGGVRCKTGVPVANRGSHFGYRHGRRGHCSRTQAESLSLIFRKDHLTLLSSSENFHL
jgi:hypothetical protein